MRYTTLVVVSAALLMCACGSDKETCDPLAQTGCDDGLVCEVVQGGDTEAACFGAIEVHGNVFDLSNAAAIAGARVMAVDVNGAAVSSVAITDANGDYVLRIPTTRMPDGTPIGVELTMRAESAGYEPFPSGLRQALPVDTTSADENGVVQSAATDIGMLPLPAGAGTGEIFGTVEIPESGGGVLVVAETSGGDAFFTIADFDGNYRILNVPAGSYTVTAYSQGVNYTPGTADVADAGEIEVDLVLNGDPAGTVMGSVQIVNAPGGSLTSVILVVESTFNEVVGRGQTVPGLRDPEPGTVPNIESAYTIDGVPAGRYVVLAAFENDNLVRDPDLSIGGTSILHIEVSAGQTTTVDGFKVTEALQVFSPGANGLEEITTATPDFTWKDDSSEDEYVVEVFNAFGQLVWDTSIAGVSGSDPVVTYAGPALEPGMIYQFRATSLKSSVPLSRTEDLRGVFSVAASQ